MLALFKLYTIRPKTHFVVFRCYPRHTAWAKYFLRNFVKDNLVRPRWHWQTNEKLYFYQFGYENHELQINIIIHFIYNTNLQKQVDLLPPLSIIINNIVQWAVVRKVDGAIGGWCYPLDSDLFNY